MVFVSRAKGKGQTTQTWGLVSAKLRGAWRFRGERRSHGNSCCSLVVKIIGCTGDGVGLFLVVHLYYIIFIFDSSVGEEGK